MIATLTAAALFLLGAAPPGRPAPAPGPAPRHTHDARHAHNTHIAHARIVIEGPVVIARVRMFRDDLEKALKLKVSEESAAQASVSAYIGKNLGVSADGAPLTAEVVDSGGDSDGDQRIWWVLVQWKAARPVEALGLKVHVLFDTFSDQQNIVVVNRQPSDDRRSLYFQAGDLTEQVVRF